jgi:hypothetical protein
VVFDDACEFGLFLHDRNKKADEVSSYLKCVVNSIGAGEYMKNYPDIGQMLFNWVPSFDMASQVTTDAAGKHWWEMEIAMDLADLEMPVEHKAGDRVDIGLFAVVHNPGWQWLDFPSASGHLERHGFPQAVLTADQPYVQVEEISGLHDRKLAYRSVVYNPADRPARVAARLSVQDGTKAKAGQFGELADGVDVVAEQRDLEIPAKGSARFDVVKDLPGLKAAEQGKGFLRITLTPKDQPAATPVYTYACNFQGTDKTYLATTEYKPALGTRIAFTPAAGRLSLGVDALDAPIPAGTTPAGATYKVMHGDEEIAAGTMRYFSNHWYDDLLELGDIPPGAYSVSCALVDAAGKELATAKTDFQKQDDAKAFAAWWNNKIGDSDKLLKPFEALQVRKGSRANTAISCTRRVYELGALGLPVQIESNGGAVLAEPARIVLRVDGKDHAVPVDASVEVTDKKDWRVDFKSGPMTVAGVTFSATDRVADRPDHTRPVDGVDGPGQQLLGPHDRRRAGRHGRGVEHPRHLWPGGVRSSPGQLRRQPLGRHRAAGIVLVRRLGQGLGTARRRAGPHRDPANRRAIGRPPGGDHQQPDRPGGRQEAVRDFRTAHRPLRLQRLAVQAAATGLPPQLTRLLRPVRRR